MKCKLTSAELLFVPVDIYIIYIFLLIFLFLLAIFLVSVSLPLIGNKTQKKNPSSSPNLQICKCRRLLSLKLTTTWWCVNVTAADGWSEYKCCFNRFLSDYISNQPWKLKQKDQTMLLWMFLYLGVLEEIESLWLRVNEMMKKAVVRQH